MTTATITQLLEQPEPERGGSDIPKKLGKYVPLKEVGNGSTGVVYLAHDPYYGRDVAVKVYNREIMDGNNSDTGAATEGGRQRQHRCRLSRA